MEGFSDFYIAKDKVENNMILSLNRSEKFNLALAIIGLVADLIGIGTLAVSLVKVKGSLEYQAALPVDWRIVVIASSFHGWFVLAWVFVRKHYCNLIQQLNYVNNEISNSTMKYLTKKFFKSTVRAVAGIGILMVITLLVVIISITSELEIIIYSIVGVPFLGLLLGWAIILMVALLMPIIYKDMAFISLFKLE